MPGVAHDAALPPDFPPVPTTVRERHGHLYSSASWSGETLRSLAAVLAQRGGDSLRRLDDDRLLAVWRDTLETFLRPDSDERLALQPLLEAGSRLSAEGLQAGLEALISGVTGAAAEELVRLARHHTHEEKGKPILVVLASNLPALGVQPLLAALASRRPMLLKSPSAEPFFLPALLRALARREPSLGMALAAAVWKGGDHALETPLLESVGPVLAYGGQQAIDDLTRRAPGRVVAYGPKASIAVLGRDTRPRDLAAGLARDVALFDQRGCLSIQAIYTAAPPVELADALALELAELARRWPPGPPDPVAAAAVHQLRAEADLRGLYRPSLSLREGTVVVEPLPELRPSPGLRTVRIHPLRSLQGLEEGLLQWQGRLQGAALSGGDAWSLQPRLEELGLSRFSAPGELQSPDALWHNGGLHPLAALG